MKYLLILITYTFLSAQISVLSTLYSNLGCDKLKITKTIKVNLTDSANEVNFSINNVIAKLIFSEIRSAQFYFIESGRTMSVNVGYPVSKFYLIKLSIVDLDNDSVDDILLTNNIVGGGGRGGSTIIQTAIIFFKNDGSKHINTFSSFFGGEENFYDIDNDHKYEYVCIKLIEPLREFEAKSYFLRNIFTLDSKNVTKEFKHPLLFEENEEGIIVLSKVPNDINVVMESPDILR